MLLFAGAVACGVGVRVAFRPFDVAFARLQREGSSAKVETQLARALGNARPFVIGIWVLTAIAAFIGLNHERLFGP